VPPVPVVPSVMAGADGGAVALTWGAGERSGLGAVFFNPLLDISGFPHFAHTEHHHGCRKVGARDELLNALTTDAEACADLGCPHQVVHGGQHSHYATCRLTMGQEYGKLVV